MSHKCLRTLGMSCSYNISKLVYSSLQFHTATVVTICDSFCRINCTGGCQKPGYSALRL